MKVAIIGIVAMVILAACAPATPSADLVATSVAQTLAAVPPTAQPTNTHQPAATSTTAPTVTPHPTSIPRPSNTPAPAQTMDDLRQEMIGVIIDILENGEGLEAIDEVTVVRYGEPGIMEIELVNAYSAKDNQPDLSYDIIRFLAISLTGGMDKKTAALLANGDDFAIQLTTYSNDGDYKYQSTTSWEVLDQVADKVITYEEWIELSSAGFK